MNLKRMMLVLASMALAAVALAAPASAQQTHGLTENQKFLAPGALVVLTSTNLQTVTGNGTMDCKKVNLSYHVDANTNTHVELDPTPVANNNATTEECKLTTSGGGTHPVHISNAGTGKVTFNTWGTGVAASTFTARITFPFFTAHCVFSGNVHLQATNGTSTVHIGPSALTGVGFGCGNGTISGTGTAKTPDKTPLVIDSKPTP